MHEEVEAGGAGRQEQERHVEGTCNEVVCNDLSLRVELQLRSHRPLLRCHTKDLLNDVKTCKVLLVISMACHPWKARPDPRQLLPQHQSHWR